MLPHPRAVSLNTTAASSSCNVALQAHHPKCMLLCAACITCYKMQCDLAEQVLIAAYPSGAAVAELGAYKARGQLAVRAQGMCMNTCA